MSRTEPAAAADAVDLELGPVVVSVATDAGPRVVGYARPGRPQILADLPGQVIDRPTGPPFRFLGGHRLWRAPEDPDVTYQPDDHGVVLREVAGGVELTGAPDTDGVVKALTIVQRAALTVVHHTLRNTGTAPVRVAPWAITQVAPGGTAYLPQPVTGGDAIGPDRHLVLWPYADPGAPEVHLGRDLVRVEASRRPSRFKVGQPNRRGWIAYHLGDQLLVKWAPLHDDALAYPDLGSSVQCYRDERFLELETLGPLTVLAPGAALTHREGWLLLDVGGDGPTELLASLPVTAPGAPR